MHRLLARGVLLVVLAAPASVALPTGSAEAHTADAARASVVAAKSGGVKTKKSCKPGKYKPNYKIVSSSFRPMVTHVSTYGIGPGVNRKVTKSSAYSETASSKVTFSSEVSAETGGFAKVIAKASVKVGFGLEKTKTHTSTKSVTVEDYVANNTRKNKQYVFYKGVSFAHGKYRYYRCVFYYVNGQSYGYARVTYYPGKWQSYGVPGDGALRCGAGTKNIGALGREALTNCKA